MIMKNKCVECFVRGIAVKTEIAVTKSGDDEAAIARGSLSCTKLVLTHSFFSLVSSFSICNMVDMQQSHQLDNNYKYMSHFNHNQEHTTCSAF